MIKKSPKKNISSIISTLVSFILTITTLSLFLYRDKLYEWYNELAINQEEEIENQPPSSDDSENEGNDNENNKNDDEDINKDDDKNEVVAPLEKRLYCQYDSTMSYEASVGGLKIYIPTHVGYINYNLGHSVIQSANCDTWRLTLAYAYDDDLKNPYAITTSGEWDMALRLADRPDFIGGAAHGDEVYTSFCLYLDDIEKEVTSLTELTTYEELRIEVYSIGYDPNDHITEVLRHYKEFVVTKNGIELNQRVEWLNDYSITACYMAMMPPAKTLTDSYYTDTDTSLKDITTRSFKVYDCKTAVLVGKESHLRYSMSIPKYPSYSSGNHFLMTDNSGGAYNKMYFVICYSGAVTKGEVWETTTKYNIIHS